MKVLASIMWTSLALHLAACSKQVAESDLATVLPGTWSNEINTSSDGEDSYTCQKLTEVYEPDGTYSADGVVEIRDAASGKTILKVSGPDKGTWRVVDEQLEVKLASSEIDLFESTEPFFTRELFERVLAEEIETPAVYEVIEIEQDRIRVRDIDDGTIHELIRSS